MLPMRKIIPASFFRTSTHPLDSLSTAAFPSFPLSLANSILLHSRSLAQVRSKHGKFPETWYTSSGPPGHAWGDNNLSRSEGFKVNERTVRLGNSRQTIHSMHLNQIEILRPDQIMTSNPNAANPFTYPPRLPASARDPIPPYFAPPLPINPPPSPHGIGESSLPRGTVDGACGMGPRPDRGQCEADHPQRADGEERTPGARRVVVKRDQGTIGSAMEDVR